MTTLAESFLADLEDLSDEDVPVKREDGANEVRMALYAYIRNIDAHILYIHAERGRRSREFDRKWTRCFLFPAFAYRAV